MVKHFLVPLYLVIGLSPAAFAQDRVESAIDNWIKANSENVSRQKVLVSAAIEKGKYPNVKKLQSNDYFNMLGLQQPSVANSRLFFKVNGFRPNNAIEAATMLGMDLVLEFGKDKVTVSHAPSKKSFRIPSPKTEAELINGLRNGFGYDGYVVATRENLILARVAGNLLQKGSQAIIINSVEPFLTNVEKAGAASLIEMIARVGDFGVFRILIGSSGSTILPGARVQFAAP